jgi:hypothetical protein
VKFAILLEKQVLAYFSCYNTSTWTLHSTGMHSVGVERECIAGSCTTREGVHGKNALGMGDPLWACAALKRYRSASVLLTP